MRDSDEGEIREREMNNKLIHLKLVKICETELN
jgi:hypothetical protein